MKKIERLEFVRNTFGRQYVLEYFECRDWKQMERAIEHFDMLGIPWSMRTDSAGENIEQAKLSPFVFLCDRQRAFEVWQQHGRKLSYIIFKAMPRCFFNAVARRIDDETVLFEFNESEPEIPQRDMYRHPENLSHLLVGQMRRHDYPGLPWPVFLPGDSEVAKRKFDEIYRLIFSTDEKELTFSLSDPERQLVIW